MRTTVAAPVAIGGLSQEMVVQKSTFSCRLNSSCIAARK